MTISVRLRYMNCKNIILALKCGCLQTFSWTKLTRKCELPSMRHVALVKRNEMGRATKARKCNFFECRDSSQLRSVAEVLALRFQRGCLVSKHSSGYIMIIVCFEFLSSVPKLWKTNGLMIRHNCSQIEKMHFSTKSSLFARPII